MAAARPFLSGPNEGELRCGPGDTCTWFKATRDLTSGTFTLVEEHAARGESVPLHVHADDDESFYVLEGEVTFYIGDTGAKRAGAGTFAHVPGGTVHGFRTESDPTRYLILTTARHGEFYRAITRPVKSVGDRFEEVTEEQIGKACQDFGIDYVGPLPDAEPA